MKRRVKDLCSAFAYSLDAFDEINIFTDPSLYFHFQTLARLRDFDSLSSVFKDTQYIEYLYATLTAWGLHRMGRVATKLVDFESFQESLKRQKDNIIRLQNLRLIHLSNRDLNTVTDEVCDILSNKRISKSGTQLVAGTKALHLLFSI